MESHYSSSKNSVDFVKPTRSLFQIELEKYQSLFDKYDCCFQKKKYNSNNLTGQRSNSMNLERPSTLETITTKKSTNFFEQQHSHSTIMSLPHSNFIQNTYLDTVSSCVQIQVTQQYNIHLYLYTHNTLKSFNSTLIQIHTCEQDKGVLPTPTLTSTIQVLVINSKHRINQQLQSAHRPESYKREV